MFAGEWNVLSRPNNKVVGPNGVLEGGTVGAGVFTPSMLDGLALWLDAIDQNSLLASDGSVIEDGEAVALWSDKSGNSAENCLVLNGVTGNYASAPDSAALSPAGSFDIDVGVALSDWTPSTTQALLGKDDAASERSFLLFITATTGVPVCNVFDSAGTSFGFVCSTAPTVADRQLLYLRAKITWALAGNCLCDFFTSTDGVSWSALGTQQSVAATGNAIKDSTGAFSIGQRVSGSNQLPSTGIFYRARLYSGDRDSGGTLAFDADFTAQSKLATSFTESSSNAATVTINTSGATGARISGARDLYQGTVANRPVFLKYNGEKYGYLNGVSGNYFSTPDASALDITGDLEIQVKCALSDWTPSAAQSLVSKFLVTGNQRSYLLSVLTTGHLRLTLSTDGTTTEDNDSTATIGSTGVADGSAKWLKATLDADNGLTQHVVTFYTSDDGSTWSQLGNPVTTAGTISIYQSTALLEVGAASGGNSNRVIGSIYRAQVYSGIGGTKVADFSASDYPMSGGSTFVSSATGETWTLNGGSHIVQRTGLYFDGSNDHLKSAPFSLSQPESVYLVGQEETWGSGDTLFDGASNRSMSVLQFSSSPQVGITADGGVSVVCLVSPVLKSCKVYAAKFNGGSSAARFNRNIEVTGNAGSLDANGFTLGSRSDALPTTHCNFFVSEILIYAAAHDTATQDRLALYAGRKWKFAV